MEHESFPIRPVRKRRAFEEILQQFEEAVSQSRLTPGSRLPPERELSAQLQVSRTSVREALRVLETLGLVEVKHGADHGALLLAEPGNSFTYLFQLYLALKHVRLESVIHSHAMIEAWAAEVVVGNPPPGLFGQLDRIVAEMRAPAIDQWQFHLLDLEFHASIVRASGNELGALFFEGCQNAIERSILREITHTGEWASVRAHLVNEHHDILRALQRGDRRESRNLVTQHILKWARLAALIDDDTHATADPDTGDIAETQ